MSFFKKILFERKLFVLFNGANTEIMLYLEANISEIKLKAIFLGHSNMVKTILFMSGMF